MKKLVFIVVYSLLALHAESQKFVNRKITIMSIWSAK